MLNIKFPSDDDRSQSEQALSVVSPDTEKGYPTTGGQSEQALDAVCPVRFPYFPAGHGDITPPGQYDPTGQRVQLRESIDPGKE